ncbi:Asp23/Gls24 family envelope stress response protein [Actinophytocola glycyrrhizae]|uniref:Asp23/Gls24 family envelope stress response protein n=1 Tax=Actinophytocola glycyrrhizae TaxID=2044873 RepID=A0ABV9S5V5_9PSEU
MSDTMNNIFGRVRNEASDTDVIDVEQTDAVAPSHDAPSVEDVAEGTDTAQEAAPDADEDDVLTEDAATVTVVPVTVAPSDVLTEAGDAPVVAAAEARPAARTRGNTTVADGVVSEVVNMVAREVDGVYRLDDEDISVTVDSDIATIRVALTVEHGHAVRTLAEQVRIDVIDAVEQFLGLDVAAVDVHVSDIHSPEAV